MIDAAKLLRRGAKMLSYYCPECHFPLFEIEGKIFCPNCEKEVIIEKEKKEELKIEHKTVSGLLEGVEKAILKICELIINSNSTDEIRVLSESLEKIANAREKLKK